MKNKFVTISVSDGIIFYHVFGDNRKYLNFDSLLLHHKELSEYLNKNKFDLKRSFWQKQETFHLV